MTKRWLWKVQERRADGLWYRMFERYYDTKAEAENALAGWSLRCFEHTGTFDHDVNLRVKREAA